MPKHLRCYSSDSMMCTTWQPCNASMAFNPTFFRLLGSNMTQQATPRLGSRAQVGHDASQNEATLQPWQQSNPLNGLHSPCRQCHVLMRHLKHQLALPLHPKLTSTAPSVSSNAKPHLMQCQVPARRRAVSGCRLEESRCPLAHDLAHKIDGTKLGTPWQAAPAQGSGPALRINGRSPSLRKKRTDWK